MKKTLFFEELYALILSLVITAILAFSMSGTAGAVLKLPMQNGRISADTVVIKNDKIEYSTRQISQKESRDLIFGLKTNESEFESAKVRYNVSVKDFSDGTAIVLLEPDINQGRLYALFGIVLVVVFFLVHTSVIWFMGKKREREIIAPIERLLHLTESLSKGDFDVHIPDEGLAEVRLLSQAVEKLRVRLRSEVYYSKKADEDRKFLISGMSHDLRTPLTSLVGYLEGILDGVAKTPEAQRVYIEKSLEKAELINRMITDLLAYSKLDLQQVEFKMQPISAAGYLSALVEENKVLFERENKKITLDIKAEKDYNIYVDVHQLDRVLANVLENALKYTKKGIGEVLCALRANSGSVIIEIRDNGEGITKEDIPKIFDRFYRGEKSRKAEGSSGLGLAISKRIVENMGGRIWAQSRVGYGTSIMISFKKYEDIQ